MKTDTFMHNSPLGCQTWLNAIYQMTTNLKGVSSMKLHRDLEITQKLGRHPSATTAVADNRVMRMRRQESTST